MGRFVPADWLSLSLPSSNRAMPQYCAATYVTASTLFRRNSPCGPPDWF